MLESLDSWPLNIALLGKGNTVSAESMWEQLRAGAAGFKLHEDWGTTPAAIDACLTVADAAGVQVNLHSDTLNEAGFVEDTLAAIDGRAIHAYHTEGAGGGHAPDIITVVNHAHVLPSSTNPTRPHTVNTLDEHLDMLMVCHHLNPSIPEDLAFAESRIRPSTIAAEDLLHDIGAISMIGSDAQAMGRIGEVVIRTWQTAHVMKRRRGALPGDDAADNNRARRYVAKYTICPAVAHGLDHEIGSVEVGKLADLVLWEPAFFGVRPHAVIKGGMIAWAAMGDANASIPTPQPVLPRPMFGAAPAAAAATSVHFVSPQAIEDGLADRLAVNRRLVRGHGCPQGRQGRHAAQRRVAAHRGRSRHVHRAHRRRCVAGAACHRIAHGAALFPLLGVSCSDDQPGDAAHDGRLAVADRWPRAFRRRRGGGDQRAGRRPRDAAGVSAPPDPHPGPGDGLGRRRRAHRHAVDRRRRPRNRRAHTGSRRPAGLPRPGPRAGPAGPPGVARPRLAAYLEPPRISPWRPAPSARPAA